jgi:hypothetical protein
MDAIFLPPKKINQTKPTVKYVNFWGLSFDLFSPVNLWVFHVVVSPANTYYCSFPVKYPAPHRLTLPAATAPFNQFNALNHFGPKIYAQNSWADTETRKKIGCFHQNSFNFEIDSEIKFTNGQKKATTTTKCHTTLNWFNRNLFNKHCCKTRQNRKNSLPRGQFWMLCFLFSYSSGETFPSHLHNSIIGYGKRAERLKREE